MKAMLVLPFLLSCAPKAVPPAPAASEAPPATDLSSVVQVVQRHGSQDPVAWGLKRLGEHDVLVVGEYHRLAPQIRYVAELVRTAAEAQLDFDLAIELVTAAGQEQLDALMAAPDFDRHAWWQVLGLSYLPGPATIATYEEPIRAAWEANRARPGSVRVIGLHPDCSLAARGDVPGVHACEDDRDSFMARTARAQVLDAERKLLLFCGSRHAAVRLVRKSGYPMDNVATLLAKTHQVHALLLAGPAELISEDPPLWGSTCGGLFDEAHDALGTPFAIGLDQPPLDSLTYRCENDWFMSAMPLRDAYQSLAYLQPPAKMPHPEPLPREFFELVGQEVIDGWNRHLVEVLKRPESFLERGIDDWAAGAVQEAGYRGAIPTAPPDWGDGRFQLPAAEAPIGQRATAAAAAQQLRYRVTTPPEAWALLGPPRGESAGKDGGARWLKLEYEGLVLGFARRQEPEPKPYTLRWAGGLDIGERGAVPLRDLDELARLDAWEGLQGVSLEALDLRDQGELVRSSTFDTRTIWPPAERLPPDFDPQALLEAGRNPGLGLRQLHAQGIDGRGVGLAIVDQPLLLGHQEYAASILRYDASGLRGVEPQMHGPPVTSIAAGRSLGVAPAAALSYYAVPMWSYQSGDYAALLDRILARNQELPADERVRVVSISTGMFPQLEGFDLWRAALERAEEAGVLVITCDTQVFRYGLLQLVPGADPDDPSSYRRSRYAREGAVLLVPGAGRSLASHRGPQVYQLDPDGGMSWGAPWIAGLAVLGFQVAPELEPRALLGAMLQTARLTEVGPVADPAAFVAHLSQLAAAEP